MTITHFSTVDAFDWSNATVADLDAILYPELGVDRLSQEISKLLKDPKTTEQDLLDVYERECQALHRSAREGGLLAPAHQLLGAGHPRRDRGHADRAVLRAPAPAPGPQRRIVGRRSRRA